MSGEIARSLAMEVVSTIQCDECGAEPELNRSIHYIRVQVWGFDRFEREFCSVKCMKKYTRKWNEKVFADVND